MRGHERLADRFGGLTESAPDAMLIVDWRGEIVLVNRQAEKLFGYRRAELLGQRIEMLIPHRFRDGTRATARATPPARMGGRWARDSSSRAAARTPTSSRSTSRSAQWRRRMARW